MRVVPKLISTEGADGASETPTNAPALRVLTDRIAARSTDERTAPFILPWRQSPDADRRHLADEASCGCGPVD
jgi:hypothetical protein